MIRTSLANQQLSAAGLGTWLCIPGCALGMHIMEVFRMVSTPPHCTGAPSPLGFSKAMKPGLNRYDFYAWNKAVTWKEHAA